MKQCGLCMEEDLKLLNRKGKKYIKAYRLQYMPQPYNYVKINDKSTT